VGFPHSREQCSYAARCQISPGALWKVSTVSWAVERFVTEAEPLINR